MSLYLAPLLLELRNIQGRLLWSIVTRVLNHTNIPKSRVSVKHWILLHSEILWLKKWKTHIFRLLVKVHLVPKVIVSTATTIPGQFSPLVICTLVHSECIVKSARDNVCVSQESLHIGPSTCEHFLWQMFFCRLFKGTFLFVSAFILQCLSHGFTSTDFFCT